MPEFEITPMRAENAPAIVALAETCGLAPWTDADYRAEAGRSDSFSFVAMTGFDDPEILGFVVMRLITNKEYNLPAQYEILNLAVKENHRKSGVGTALTKAAIHATLANSPVHIWLEVRSGNASAIRFYEKHGFTREHLRRNFYSRPVEDGIVMKLNVY